MDVELPTPMTSETGLIRKVASMSGICTTLSYNYGFNALKRSQKTKSGLLMDQSKMYLSYCICIRDFLYYALESQKFSIVYLNSKYAGLRFSHQASSNSFIIHLID